MKKEIHQLTLMTGIMGFLMLAQLFFFYHMAYEVGNNYDHSNLFVLYLIVPAVLFGLVLGVLAKIVDIVWIHRVILLLSLGGSVALALLALEFETYNGDHPLYIFAYLQVFYPVLISLLFVCAFSLILIMGYRVLEEKKWIVGREQRLRLVKSLIDIFATAIAGVLALSLIARFWSVGVAFLVLTTILLMYGVLFLIVERDISLLKRSTGVQKKSKLEKEDQQISTRIGLQALVIFLVNFIVGYVYPIDFLRYPGNLTGETHYFFMNPRAIYEEGILALALILCCLFGMAKAISRKREENLEFIVDNIKTRPLYDKKAWTDWVLGNLGVVVVGLAFIQWGLMNLGRNFFFLRISGILTPLILLVEVIWLLMVIRERDKNGGLRWSIALSFGFLAFFGGFMLGNDGSSGFPAIYFTLGLVFSLIIVIVLAILRNAKISRKLLYKEPEAEPQQASRHKADTRLFYKEIWNEKKRILAVALVAMTLFPVATISVAARLETNFQVLANVDNQCVFYLADPMTRIDKHYRPRFGLEGLASPNATIQISAAQNEYESIQIVMLPLYQAGYSLYDVSFSGFTHSNGEDSIDATNFEAYVVEYVEALSEVVSDRLVDFHSFAMSTKTNQPLWFTFYVPDGTQPGDYSGTLTFRVSDRSDPENWLETHEIEFNIQLKVHNFRLPTIPSLKSDFGSSGVAEEYYEEMMERFRERRMMDWYRFSIPTCTVNPDGSINTMNYTKTETEIQAAYAMNFYSLGFKFREHRAFSEDTFLVNGINYTPSNYSLAPEFNETIKEYFELFEAQMKSQTYLNDFGEEIRWYDDIYYLGYDEITAHPPEVYEMALEHYRFLKWGANMSFPIMQTTNTLPDELAEVIDIICYHGEGDQPDWVAEWQAQGNEAWLYTTRGPRFPSPSLSTSGFLTQARALAWQCWTYNYSHYLIWDVHTPYNAELGYGYQGWSGGSILYTYPTGYALSTRMEMIREGWEDYEYFALLERRRVVLAENAEENAAELQEISQLQEEIDNLIANTIPEMNYRRIYTLRENIATILSTPLP